MDLFTNNYFQSEEFKYLNQYIFKYKIINLKKSNFFILRNNLQHNQKFTLGKSEIGTELKGFLEFFGQPTDFNKPNFESELDLFLEETKNIIKKFTPGVVAFRVVDIEKEDQLVKVNKIFFNHGYLCRSWLSNIINIPQNNEKYKNFSYNIRREIKLIENLNILVEEVKIFEQYELYIKLFFNSYGHFNYPNKKNYLQESTWNNLKKNHSFFIIKINNEPFSVFGVRIYNNRSYWCMVGRSKKFKYSLHTYSIYFLLEYLKKKKIDYLDLAGFNPDPTNNKEIGIKNFKQKFRDKIIYQPTFIFDNTKFIKILRKGINTFKKIKTFPDQFFF